MRVTYLGRQSLNWAPVSAKACPQEESDLPVVDEKIAVQSQPRSFTGDTSTLMERLPQSLEEMHADFEELVKNEVRLLGVMGDNPDSDDTCREDAHRVIDKFTSSKVETLALAAILLSEDINHESIHRIRLDPWDTLESYRELMSIVKLPDAKAHPRQLASLWIQKEGGSQEGEEEKKAADAGTGKRYVDDGGPASKRVKTSTASFERETAALSEQKPNDDHSQSEVCSWYGNRCVLTGVTPVGAHIFPIGLRFDSDIAHFWQALNMFWGTRRTNQWREAVSIAAAGPANIIPLSSNAHAAWHRHLFALRPIRDLDDPQRCIYLQLDWATAADLCSGERVDPVVLKLTLSITE